jgi:hypothetical protein
MSDKLTRYYEVTVALTYRKDVDGIFTPEGTMETISHEDWWEKDDSPVDAPDEYDDSTQNLAVFGE